MANKSSIEWTDTTWSCVTGCSYKSEGCRWCYAAAMTKRLEAMGHEKYSGLTGKGHFNGVIKMHASELERPLRWRKPRRVFVNSMSDLFHPGVPFTFIDRVFAVMAMCPQHQFQVLTKRPERMAEYLNDRSLAMRLHEAVKFRVGYDHPGRPAINSGDLPFDNFWAGTSVEDQATADERIAHLLRCPAAVRFLSCEPLLEKVELFGALLDQWCPTCQARVIKPCPICGREPHPIGGIEWAIVGGESGPNARPCDPDWIRHLVQQCESAAVPCFVKQLGTRPVGLQLKDSKGGDPDEWPEDLRVRQMPEAVTS